MYTASRAVLHTIQTQTRAIDAELTEWPLWEVARDVPVPLTPYERTVDFLSNPCHDIYGIPNASLMSVFE
jgi:hypothetical protein